jgi:hypothetical protein
MRSWSHQSRSSVTGGGGCCLRRLDLWLCTFCRATCRTPPSVELFLVLESLARSIVLLAPLVRLLAATVLTASERAVEILPIGVPRMGQEANGAVPAVDRAACQTRTSTQDRIERGLILTNKRTSTIVLMPVRAKCKEFPGGYDKNARFSVKMLILFDTPSSYELDADASRSRARFFAKSRASELAQPLDVLQNTSLLPRACHSRLPNAR